VEITLLRAFTAAACAATLVFSGCSSTHSDGGGTTATSGPRLSVGFKKDESGLSSLSGSTFIGFEPTMAGQLLNRLGYDMTAVTVDQSTWMTALTDPKAQNHADVVISAISDRELRDAPGISFARSYLQTDLGALTLDAKQVDIKTEEDLKDRNVCTVAGSTARAEIEARIKDDWHINSVQGKTPTDCLKHLTDGEDIVYVSDQLILAAFAADSATTGQLLKLSSGDFGKYQYYSIAMEAGNSLCEKFVSALKKYVGGDDWVKDLTTNLKLTLTPAQIKTRFSTPPGEIDDHHCR
jgi:ABC-type amino acid transport substrate-binding protein